MPPSRAQQNTLVKGVAAWTYIKRPDKSPLRPLVPILRTRWADDIYDWIGKQDERFPELIAYGYMSVKGGDIVFSTLEQATDYHLGYLTTAYTPRNPAPMVYVRTADTLAKIALNSHHAELDRDDLHKHRYRVSLLDITRASRAICNSITSTCDEATVISGYEADFDFDGLALLRSANEKEPI